MTFTAFEKENKDLLQHLENLGFQLSDYEGSIYWHFHDSFDALKYYDNEGIVLFSIPQNLIKPKNTIIKNMQDANDMYFAFKQSDKCYELEK